MGRTDREGTCYRDIEYSPLPSQDRFHQSTARFKGFSGPIGSGKSQALCQEAIRLSYLNPGRAGLLGAPTYPMLRDATQSTLFEILGQEPDSVRVQQGGERADDDGHAVADHVPAGGRVRAAAGHEPGVVRAGRADLHGGGGVAAAGRTAAGSEGEAVVRLRGVDAEGFRLGVPAVRGAARWRATR